MPGRHSSPIHMVLREFVTQAILDIVGAIEDAQKKTPVGTVVPAGISSRYQAIEAGITRLQVVDFEVVVKADERSGSEAKLSVAAAVIGGRVKGESGKSGGHSATLRFRIPLRLPESGRQ